MKIQVVSPEEAEEATMVVCCRVGMPRHFDDDLEGVCSHCGQAVFFRPNSPKTPPKVCIECVTDMMRGGHA